MNNENSLVGALKSGFASIVIILALVVSYLVYHFVLGNPANFEGGDPEKNPLPGNFLGIVHKGGQIVPILITIDRMFLTKFFLMFRP